MGFESLLEGWEGISEGGTDSCDMLPHVRSLVLVDRLKSVWLDIRLRTRLRLVRRPERYCRRMLRSVAEGERAMSPHSLEPGSLGC